MNFIEFLQRFVQENISDVLFKVGSPPFVRKRNGELVRADFRILTPKDTEIITANLLEDGVDIDEITDCETSLPIPGFNRFKVTIYRQRGTLAVAMKVIPQKIPTVASLRLPGVVDEIAESKQGLILVTGDNCSGRSSTIASMLNHINHVKASHINTIEDPIEYIFRDELSVITQRELGKDVRNLKEAMRTIQRQSPDVVYIFEIKDIETLNMAFSLASSGILVMSTMTQDNVEGTLTWIINKTERQYQRHMRQQIADHLIAVIAQRLLPQKGSDELIVALEILRGSTEFMNFVTNEETFAGITELIEQGVETHGNVTLDQCLLNLCLQGYITEKTALSNAYQPNIMEKKIIFKT